MEEQFETHFSCEEIEILSRQSKFVQRTSRLDGFTFLSLVVFNSDSLAYESLNDLSTKLELDHGVEITEQALDKRFNKYAVNFLKTALEKLLQKQLAAPEVLIQCKEFERILITKTLSVSRLMSPWPPRFPAAAEVAPGRMSGFCKFNADY